MDKLKELEDRLTKLEKRVTTLEKEKTSTSNNYTNLSELQKLLIEKTSELKPQDLVILILYSTPKQTREQIKNKFQTLGATKKMLNWFRGGNFKQRLIDAGLLFEDGKNDDGPTYSLTKGKGTQKALSVIEKLKN